MDIKENISLAPYTVYKIGGLARYFVEVKNFEEISEALHFAKDQKIPFFVLGAGSNILVSDRGFFGLVIRMAKGGINIHDDEVIATGDAMMALIVLKTAQAGLTGFEWAIGIPGTIGGSVRGNAGCFGGEMNNAVKSVRYISADNFEFKELPRSECQFAYRDSIFKRHPEWIILSVTLGLSRGDRKAIQENIKKITLERAKKQDIGTKSCGCIFKNVLWARKDIDKGNLLSHFPELNQFSDRDTIPASYLIDAARLKGKKIGHVFISPRHANFFVSEGDATAEEVIMLIGIAKSAVRRKFGITLEEEIHFVGF